jgi:hypothetical protein
VLYKVDQMVFSASFFFFYAYFLDHLPKKENFQPQNILLYEEEAEREKKRQQRGREGGGNITQTQNTQYTQYTQHNLDSTKRRKGKKTIILDFFLKLKVRFPFTDYFFFLYYV